MISNIERAWAKILEDISCIPNLSCLYVVFSLVHCESNKDQGIESKLLSLIVT